MSPLGNSHIGVIGGQKIGLAHYSQEASIIMKLSDVCMHFPSSHGQNFYPKFKNAFLRSEVTVVRC